MPRVVERGRCKIERGRCKIVLASANRCGPIQPTVGPRQEGVHGNSSTVQSNSRHRTIRPNHDLQSRQPRDKHQWTYAETGVPSGPGSDLRLIGRAFGGYIAGGRMLSALGRPAPSRLPNRSSLLPLVGHTYESVATLYRDVRNRFDPFGVRFTWETRPGRGAWPHTGLTVLPLSRTLNGRPVVVS
jgi:hypothetical protein